MKDKYYYGFDLLRGLASFGIVGCHLFLAPMTHEAASLLHFCDLGVALFGTMSGFFLALSYESRKDCDLKALVSHRSKRIIPVYLVWTAVYLVASPVFNFVVRHNSINQRYFEWSYWVSALFRGGSSTHLWYLAWLFWWSIVLYLMWKGHSIFRKASVMVGLSLTSLIVCVSVGGSYCDYGLRLFVFMSLGAALYSTRNIYLRIPRCILLLAVVITLCIHVVMPVHAYIRDFITTLAVIPFFARISLADSNVVSLLGDLSFGVYLIHPIFTVFFAALCFKFFGTPTSVIVLVADWIVVFVLCSIIAFILKRIRALRWIVM